MRHLLWVLLIFLSACHQQNIKPESLKVSEIKAQNWSMFGKMAFNDGQDGGSGSIIWSENNNLVEAEFKAPLGQGSWQLDESKGQLKNNKGHVWSGQDMATLLSQQLGWRVPWDSLKKSIRGEAPEHITENSFILDGWHVQWKKIQMVNGQWMPHKIFMNKAPYSIKISVKSWKW